MLTSAPRKMPSSSLSRTTTQTMTVMAPAIRRKASTQLRLCSTSAARNLPTGLAVLESDAPLSAMPAGVLLRSIFINSISSRPLLLRPSLWFLSQISKPDQNLLFSVDRNVLLRSLLKRTFYKQFCAGENGAETQATMKSMKKMGFRGTILTYAKETVFDHATNTQHGLGVSDSKTGDAKFCENIEAWRKGTVETVELLGEGDQLAVKLTGAGTLVTDAFCNGELPPQQMIDALDEICTKCKERKAFILIDAESQHFQWGIMRVTIDLMRRYNTDGYALIYNTYQAYLKSTASTLAKHLQAALDEGFTLGLKLVRGAYLASDQRSLIHDTKQNTDDNYNNIAQGALRREIGEFGAANGRRFPSVDLLLASHNKESVVAAHQLHQERLRAKLPTVSVKFAQLHGMSDEVSFGLLQLKGDGMAAPEVYKCSTWGTLGECMAYLTRRAMENRDAASRTLDEYTALKSEARRRLRSYLPF
ncbi:FAD-linked oxidoreductase-like protein [Thelonectria olida]|uniref:Proline dehydrogenase n=1 Tax=Thelonectria olida TaxID=1576542 RepID=A0A9P8WIP8_9HYPO|nr:FAD-linked oxidoreductase-like protein [Thelonectria olida]